MTTIDHTHDAHATSDLLDSRTSGYAMSYGIVAVFNALLVLLKESFPAVQAAMASLGHHWITQGAIDVILFVVLATMFARAGKQVSGDTATNYVIWGTLVGGGIIAAFFLAEFL
jgi:hypothetical protein